MPLLWDSLSKYRIVQTFCHHFCAAVPEDDHAATEWVKRLLKNHPDSAIDEMARIASAESHQKQYNDRLEKELKDTFGNRGSGKKVSDKRHTLIAKSRLRDNYVRGKFRPKTSARFLARTACLCVVTSFFAHKIDRRHDDLTAAADQKSLDLPSPRVGI